MVLALVIVGISAYILNRNKTKKWMLTAPQAIAGMSRDTSATDQAEFSTLVARFKSDVTGLRNYGSLKSTVSGIYRLGPTQAVGLIGFNGTFNVQVMLKTGDGLKVSKADPGPHGGTAGCGSDSSDAICQWSTGSTVGIVLVIPTNFATTRESLKSANDLMIRIRDSIERPAGSS